MVEEQVKVSEVSGKDIEEFKRNATAVDIVVISFLLILFTIALFIAFVVYSLLQYI